MAYVNEDTIRLKNGHQCILRTANQTDARAVLDFTRQAAISSPYLVLLPDEITSSVWKTRSKLKRALHSITTLNLIAYIGDEMIGYLTAASAPRIRLQHAIDFGIAISKPYQNMGLGRTMLNTMIDWAQNVPEIERIELHVHSENKMAITLYQSLGFIEEGRRRSAIKYENGTYMDDIIMGMLLPKRQTLDIELLQSKGSL